MKRYLTYMAIAAASLLSAQAQQQTPKDVEVRARLVVGPVQTSAALAYINTMPAYYYQGDGVSISGNVFYFIPADPADLNRDGEVNVGDVTTLVNMILGKTPLAPEADLNDDKVVNVGDVTTLVNIILGKL